MSQGTNGEGHIALINERIRVNPLESCFFDKILTAANTSYLVRHSLDGEAQRREFLAGKVEAAVEAHMAVANLGGVKFGPGFHLEAKPELLMLAA